MVWNIFLFFHILGTIIPTDFHIFQRGRYTTNQLLYWRKPHSLLQIGGSSWTKFNHQDFRDATRCTCDFLETNWMGGVNIRANSLYIYIYYIYIYIYILYHYMGLLNSHYYGIIMGVPWFIWLVVWNHGILWLSTFHILGRNRSQLTNSIIFQRDWNHQPVIIKLDFTDLHIVHPYIP